MKTMTCEQLGGAYKQKFQANSFEEIAVQSKQQGMQMFQQNHEAHRQAMQKMQQLMTSPEAMQK